MRRPEPNPQQTGHDGPSAPAATACASPPCLFGTCEADATTAQERASSPEAAASAWQEVRLWRKAKRQVMIDRRLAIPAAERAMHAEAVTQCLSDLLKSFDGAVVGFYWPFKGEYDPRPLARALHERGVALALPVVVAKAQPMIFRPWYPKVPMTLGIWNIPVPAAGPTVVPDVLLVPVVGFDKRGYRLGYGGGYYDRTLAAQTMRPRTLAIGFAISEIPTIYPQPHDRPMDVVVTERGIRVMRTAPAAE
ncbi:MAG TPA: 5-formyltetrahydrofolate cyclo-ligase [Rhodopila sp.]|nr:5-formyltetrahydrofolate cyclo-ligase [Rhodopila sp.]